ncbi:MmgE/PrpD family protein [Mycobacterium sp. DL592]|uniref:MmgE/PrpD family protein n=1 Tax=Mycobacterium sp. DL592 TaxID=2675524 RepID=UPI0014228195|nr:MmgE/PrpD family protein [Mycobacterium sp. DL592]
MSTVSATTTASRRFAVDALADFVVSAEPADIPGGAAALLRRNVLDSIACAIAALDGETVRAVRDQIEAVGARPRARLIGGGWSSVDQAALFNSVAVRYVDLLDTFLTPGGLCHPADNFGALLSVAESTAATGSEFLLALAVAYEVQCRFSQSVPVMAHGLNHALQLAMSVAAGSARLLGLSAAQTADAIAMAAADNVSVAAIHSEPVSHWKGISPGITAQRAVYAAALAQRGVTGPRGLIDGPNGLEHLFGQHIDLRLDEPTLGAVEHTYLKKYCALIHGQAPIDAVLALAAEHGVRHSDVETVRVDTFQTAYDIAGGGSFGDKDAPRTKEQADYNLKYLVAAALIDGQVGPDQLDTGRIRRADVQDLLSRVTVRADAALTARYPSHTPVRVTITLRDGHRITRDQDDFEGAPSHPMTWDRVIEKFHWLAAPRVGEPRRIDIVAAVAHLDDITVPALMDLLTGFAPGEPR